jgi:hypothetical protein
MPVGVYPRKRRPIVDRFLEKVERDGLLGCWIWTGASTIHGYGIFSVDGHLVHAHRVAYRLFVGEIPDGLDIDHLCRTRLCVNPAHLEPVTRQVNVQRAQPFRRDTKTVVCRAGHPRTPENTYERPDRKGRSCRPCVVEATRRWRRSHAA